MESAAALMPRSTGLNGLLPKLNILEGAEYENAALYQCTEESLN